MKRKSPANPARSAKLFLWNAVWWFPFWAMVFLIALNSYALYFPVRPIEITTIVFFRSFPICLPFLLLIACFNGATRRALTTLRGGNPDGAAARQPSRLTALGRSCLYGLPNISVILFVIGLTLAANRIDDPSTGKRAILPVIEKFKITTSSPEDMGYRVRVPVPVVTHFPIELDRTTVLPVKTAKAYDAIKPRETRIKVDVHTGRLGLPWVNVEKMGVMAKSGPGSQIPSLTPGRDMNSGPLDDFLNLQFDFDNSPKPKKP